MNLLEAKNLVSALQYLSSVTEGVFLNVIDEDQSETQRLSDAHKELAHVCDVISEVVKRLHLVSPELGAVRQEVEREALERGRKWMDERMEKIALLRLAGDDTPEEQIP